MTKKPNKKLIGLFTFIGLVLFFTIFIYFVGSKIFIDKNNSFVLFFKESIQGLKIGSPVVFKGVEIGKVTNIDLINDNGLIDYNIPVYITMNNNDDHITRKTIEAMIEQGLKARLATYSFITGQLMVEFVLLPDIEAEYLYKIKNIPEIPTVLSSKGAISEGLKNIPLKSIFDKIDFLLTGINAYLPSILKEVNGITANVNKITNIDVDKEIANNLNDTIINFNETLKSIKNLTDYLEMHPESLLKGKQEN